MAITDSIEYGMKRGSKGFYIACAHCRKEFESLGLRCCSAECERAHREREENLVIMAQAGIELTAKRKCEGPACNAIISKWHKGRKVSRNKRFCSPRCQQRAVGRLLSAISLKKCPFYESFFGGLTNGGSDIRGPRRDGPGSKFWTAENVTLNVDILVVPPTTKGRS